MMVLSIFFKKKWGGLFLINYLRFFALVFFHILYVVALY